MSGRNSITNDFAPRRALAAAAFGGAAALIHELLWIRLLSLATGATATALAIVISTFFAGLALGSAAAARAKLDRRRAALSYRILEFTIGACGLLVPAILTTLTNAAAPPWIAVLLFTIPTLAMGATLPFLCLSTNATKKGASRLYIYNTLGGAVGAGAAGFYLLEFHGVWGAAAAGAICNITAALVAAPGGVGPIPNQNDDHALSSEFKPAAILLLAFTVGAVSIAGEVILNRLLYQVLGGTTYAVTFTLMLFLLGIVAGGWFATKMRGASARILLFGLAVFGAATALSFRVLGICSEWMRASAAPEITVFGGFLASALTAAAVLAPPAFASGFLFPLLVNARGGASSAALGSVYAANTAGGILASIFVTFYFVPAFGMPATLAGAGILILLIGGMFIKDSRRWVAFAGAGVFIILQIIFPPRPEGFRLWLYDTFSDTTTTESRPDAPKLIKIEENVVFHREGSSATASVFERKLPNGETRIDFAINGKKEASNDFDALRNQYILGHLPALLANDPRRALVVGLGAGVTAGAVSVHSNMNVTVAELSPEVLDATRRFVNFNHDVLNRKNVNIVIEDGRRFLANSAREISAGRGLPFDVITSDPIHPWVSGAANLYTYDYFSLVRNNLSKNGVAAHWLPLYEMQTEDAAAIFRSFASAFPASAVWVTYAGDAVLIGSPSQLTINSERFAERARAEEVYQDLKSVRLADPLRLLAGLCVLEETLASLPGPIITDQHQFLEFHAARNLYAKYTVPKNIQFFAERVSKFERIIEFTGFDGPASPRLRSLVDANYYMMRARAAFDSEDPDIVNKIVDAFLAEPDSEHLLYLADQPRFAKEWTADSRDDSKFFVYSILAARHARRAPAAERIQRTIQLINQLKLRIVQNAQFESVDRALRKQCAILLGELKKYEEGAAILEETPARYAADPTRMRLLGRLYEKLGRAEEAKAILIKANALDLRGIND